MTNREPDFLFNMTVPINVATKEEQDMLVPHLDPFLKVLVDQGHLSEVEAASYVKFASELSAFVPFMLDGFLQSYRNEISRQSTTKQIQEDAEAAKNLDSKKLIV